MLDLFSVEGKVVLVTGGSRGIGKMIATGFVEHGARTYISARHADACEETAAELSKTGTCIALPADLSTNAGVEELASAFRAREPSLGVLVNNAGANWGAEFETFPESGWDKVMAVNLKAPFFLTQQLLPELCAAASADDPARVINIGSVDGLRAPLLETYSYSASKAAIHHMTHVLARKLARSNITVNAIAPGPFESKMMAATLKSFGEGIVKTNPRKRIGVPEDMAGVSIFLASRAGSYVTGVVIPVDGGIVGTTGA